MRLFSHLRQKQCDAASHAVARHDAFLAKYLERLQSEPDASAIERTVTVLARSPLSAPAQALIARAADLRTRGVTAKVIFARIDCDEPLRDAARVVSSLCSERPLDELLRWADNRCLLEAHEQLTLGTSMCWSGDMMRRDASKRDGLDLYEIEAQQTVRLGALAFNAIWAIAIPVPASRFSTKPGKPSGAYVRGPGDELPQPAFLRLAETPGLLRH